MSTPKIRILLVDDHIVMRMGLITAASGEPDMEIVAEARNGQEALEAFRRSSPDVAVVDLRMPKEDGFYALRQIRHEFPSAKLLVFSNYASGDEIYRAFSEGAAGFVAKDMPLEELLRAIRAVNAGAVYVPPEVSGKLNSRVQSQLSPRELEVLNLVAKGMSNKEIGSALNLVEGTVKVHLTNILGKLDVADRTQALLAAVKRGIIRLE